ncbi:hypothetical protein LIA77_11312 [Sarocladium implicatum]|jgi:hypothetical protein|nr:hypothetical protein LIA77_11312 [Sarocladium implicatum]
MACEVLHLRVTNDDIAFFSSIRKTCLSEDSLHHQEDDDAARVARDVYIPFVCALWIGYYPICDLNLEDQAIGIGRRTLAPDTRRVMVLFDVILVMIERET